MGSQTVFSQSGEDEMVTKIMPKPVWNALVYDASRAAKLDSIVEETRHQLELSEQATKIAEENEKIYRKKYNKEKRKALGWKIGSIVTTVATAAVSVGWIIKK